MWVNPQVNDTEEEEEEELDRPSRWEAVVWERPVCSRPKYNPRGVVVCSRLGSEEESVLCGKGLRYRVCYIVAVLAWD